MSAPSRRLRHSGSFCQRPPSDVIDPSARWGIQRAGGAFAATTPNPLRVDRSQIPTDLPLVPSYPLIQIRGTTFATFLASRALSAASTTAETSL